MADVTDGLSNTMLASEFLSGTNAPQAGPGKFPFDVFYAGNNNLFNAVVNKDNPTMAELDAIGSLVKNSPAGVKSNNGTMPLWYPGGQSSLNTSATPNWRWPTAAGDCCPGGAHDWTFGIMPPRSLHSGGVNSVMGDGSVKFLRDSIDLLTFQRLGSVKDGQVLGEF